jgi:hypothetical protein
MTRESPDRTRDDENEISSTTPIRDESISESVTETDEGSETTTKVFRDRVEIIRRDPDRGVRVDVMPTSVDLPE